MINDKIKVRISNFVKTIIENDTQAFGFIKQDQSSNTNAFLNKLIPNLLTMRKARRKLIHNSLNSTLEFIDENLTERTRSYIDSIVDEVYFSDNFLDELSESIWIRPSKNNLAKFDEIVEYETYITQQDTTTCVRNMLNEYAILPQFKRERIAFQEELNLLDISFNQDRVFGLEYDGERFKVVVLQFFTGYTYDQSNYVLCLDLENLVIKSLYLYKIKRIYLIDEFVEIDQAVYDKVKKIIDEQSFVNCEVFKIEE